MHAEKKSRGMLVICPPVSSNEELFVLAVVDIVNFEAALLYVWGIICQTSTRIPQNLSWAVAELPDRREEKNDWVIPKNVLFQK